MDLNKQVQIATDKVIAEKLPTMVEEKVTKMLNSILDDSFSNYGDIAKEVKSKIAEQLNVSLAEFGLVDYNVMIGQAISKELENQIDAKPIIDIVKGIVGKSDLKQIKVQDLCEKIKEISMEENASDYSGEISFYAEENSKYGWLEIFADLNGGKEKDRCAVKVLVSKDRGTIFSMSTTNYGYKQTELSPSDLINIRSIEEFFFSLYANQVHIINDYEDYWTEWERD